MFWDRRDPTFSDLTRLNPRQRRYGACLFVPPGPPPTCPPPFSPVPSTSGRDGDLTNSSSLTKEVIGKDTFISGPYTTTEVSRPNDTFESSKDFIKVFRGRGTEKTLRECLQTFGVSFPSTVRSKTGNFVQCLVSFYDQRLHLPLWGG